MDKPAPPPEAVLLTVARKVARMSGPEAAQAAGISKQRLNQIEHGWERRPITGYRPVRGSDEIIAYLAAALAVTPEQLEEAGRGDAAVVLREILRRGQEDQPAPATPAGVVREIWGDPDRAPDFIRAIAAAPSHTATDEYKMRVIRDYAKDYGSPLGPQGQQRPSRSA